MKSMKRTKNVAKQAVSFLLALAMVVTMVPATSFAAQTDETTATDVEVISEEAEDATASGEITEEEPANEPEEPAEETKEEVASGSMTTDATYTVTYDVNVDAGGTGTAPTSVTAEAGSTVTIASFSGNQTVWNSDTDVWLMGWCTTQLPVITEDNFATTITSQVMKGFYQGGDSFTMPEGDVTLYAMWSRMADQGPSASMTPSLAYWNGCWDSYHEKIESGDVADVEPVTEEPKTVHVLDVNAGVGGTGNFNVMQLRWADLHTEGDGYVVTGYENQTTPTFWWAPETINLDAVVANGFSNSSSDFPYTPDTYQGWAPSDDYYLLGSWAWPNITNTNSTDDVPVVFAGFTPFTATTKIFEKDDTLPITTYNNQEETKSFYPYDGLNYETDSGFSLPVTEGTTLYAVWGYDTNHSGIADFLEPKYSVTYDVNDGTGTVPVDSNTYLAYHEDTSTDKYTVTVLDGTDSMKNDTTDNIAFVGWTKDTKTTTPVTSKPDKLYVADDTFYQDDLGVDDDNNEIPPVDVTLYAVWAEDKNNDNIPDYEQLKLSYDVNADNGGTGTAPDTQIVAKNSDATLAEASADMANSKSTTDVPIIFAGWSADKALEVIKGFKDTADTTLTAQVLDAGDTYAMKESDVTMYAVWAEDTDKSGVPDFKESEETYNVLYEANGGEETSMPADETNVKDGATVTLSSTVPTHADKDGVEVLFVYWTQDTSAVDKIYTKDDTAPKQVTEVTINKADETVYAVWSLNENKDTGNDGKGDDTPDVLEDKYKVLYEANGGDETSMPEDEENILDGTTVTLSSTVPTHAEENGVEVLFVGWTQEEAAVDKIYTKDDTAPELLTEVTINGADETVYAVWSLNENKDTGNDGKGDDTPDVIEDKYKLIYDENGGNDDGPATVENLLDGTTVTLSTTGPTHDSEGKKNVVFLGWTETQITEIQPSTVTEEVLGTMSTDALTLDEAKDEIVTTVQVGKEDKTVYALWGYESWKPDGVVPAEKTGTTAYTVTIDTSLSEDGYPQEYSIDGGETWLSVPAGEKLHFEHLEPNTDYTILTRIAANPEEEMEASDPVETPVHTSKYNADEIAKMFDDDSETTWNAMHDVTEDGENDKVHITVNEDGNYEIVLKDDIHETVELPTDMSEIVLDLNDHTIKGDDGTEDDPDGKPGVRFVTPEGKISLPTEITVKDTVGDGEIVGGDPYEGSGGDGAPGVEVPDDVDGSEVDITVADGGTIRGSDGADSTTPGVPGGDGGAGIKGNPKVTVEEGGKVLGGNGGNGADGTGDEDGTDGGKGGPGIENTGDTPTVVNGGEVTGGDGGDGGDAENGDAGDGGDGGPGVDGDVEINGGSVNGGDAGDGGDSQNGNGGDGGDGGDTVTGETIGDNPGTPGDGGDGGDGRVPGKGGKGGVNNSNGTRGNDGADGNAIVDAQEAEGTATTTTTTTTTVVKTGDAVQLAVYLILAIICLGAILAMVYRRRRDEE